LAVRAAARETGVCTRERTIGARMKLAGRTARVAMRKTDRDDMSEWCWTKSMDGGGGESWMETGKGGEREERESC
jgi:hypothetical protein